MNHPKIFREISGQASLGSCSSVLSFDEPRGVRGSPIVVEFVFRGEMKKLVVFLIIFGYFWRIQKLKCMVVSEAFLLIVYVLFGQITATIHHRVVTLNCGLVSSNLKNKQVWESHQFAKVVLFQASEI